MASIKVMGSRGHTTVEFDPTVEKEVDHAKAEFDKLIAAGFRGMKVSAPGETDMIKSFDPEAEETIMLKPMAGGA